MEDFDAVLADAYLDVDGVFVLGIGSRKEFGKKMFEKKIFF